jgi:chaperonin cofactor prefoldin
LGLFNIESKISESHTAKIIEDLEVKIEELERENEKLKEKIEKIKRLIS